VIGRKDPKESGRSRQGIASGRGGILIKKMSPPEKPVKKSSGKRSRARVNRGGILRIHATTVKQRKKYRRKKSEGNTKKRISTVSRKGSLTGPLRGCGKNSDSSREMVFRRKKESVGGGGGG